MGRAGLAPTIWWCYWGAMGARIWWESTDPGECLWGILFPGPALPLSMHCCFEANTVLEWDLSAKILPPAQAHSNGSDNCGSKPVRLWLLSCMSGILSHWWWLIRFCFKLAFLRREINDYKKLHRDGWNIIDIKSFCEREVECLLLSPVNFCSLKTKAWRGKNHKSYVSFVPSVLTSASFAVSRLLL